MKRTTRRAGFTLVEMLVVVTIVGILAAILIPTLGAVIKQGKITAIRLELTQLSSAIEEYKMDKGDYPPDFTNEAAVLAHVRRAYRKNTFNVQAWLQNRNGNAPVVGTDYVWPEWPVANPDATRLDPAEALVFWLSGLGNNPRNPFTGGGSKERKEYYTFKTEQLTDIDQDGWPEYASEHSREVPYVYFDGRVQNAVGGGHAQCAYAWAVYPCQWSSDSTVFRPAGIGLGVVPFPAPFDLDVGVVRPYRSNEPIPASDLSTQPRSGTPGLNDTAWVKAGAFQIISSGLDARFGDDYIDNSGSAPVPVFKQFPQPNYYSSASPGEIKFDRDTVTSFAEKSIGDSFP